MGLLLRGGRGREGRERPTYKGRELKGGRGGEVREGEGKGWKGRGMEMEGLLIRGGRGRGKGRGRVPPVITVPPGPRGARIVTALNCVAQLIQKIRQCN